MYKRRTELRNQPQLRVPHSELLHRIWWSPRLSLRWNEGDTNYRTAVEAEVRGPAGQILGGQLWQQTVGATVTNNTLFLLIYFQLYVCSLGWGHRYLQKPKASTWKCVQGTELKSSMSTVFTAEPSSLQPPTNVSKASSVFSPPGSFMSPL